LTHLAGERIHSKSKTAENKKGAAAEREVSLKGEGLDPLRVYS